MPENVKTVQELATVMQKEKLEIYKEINRIDDKHTENHNEIKLMLSTFIESQKPIARGIEDMTTEIKTMNKNMTGITRRVEDVERIVATHDKYIEKRMHSNNKIAGLLISGVLGSGGLAYWLAELFLK